MKRTIMTLAALGFFIGGDFSGASAARDEALPEILGGGIQIDNFLDSTAAPISREEINWGGEHLIFETGHLNLPENAVVARSGGTMVLSWVEPISVLEHRAGRAKPIMFDYQEDAALFFEGPLKKEGRRPTEKEVLTSNFMERAFTPLATETAGRPVRVFCRVLKDDGKRDPADLAILVISAALYNSRIIEEPLAAMRVAYEEGKPIFNPTSKELEGSVLDLRVAGTDRDIHAIDGSARELSEEDILNATVYAQEIFKEPITAIKRLSEKAGIVPQASFKDLTKSKDIEKKVRERVGSQLEIAALEKDSPTREILMNRAYTTMREEPSLRGVSEAVLGDAFEKVKDESIRRRILETEKRLDGRVFGDVLSVQYERGISQNVSGNILFVHGEETGGVTTTLGGEYNQAYDSLGRDEGFLLNDDAHSSYSGENVDMYFKSPDEIANQYFMRNAFLPVLPSREKFSTPIYLNIEPNDGSSMTTVCGTSFSLRDAGVPLLRPVAGITMGLIQGRDQYAILSDVSKDEHHLGDMDFKVAGTDKGITAVQMCAQSLGITPEILKKTLFQARDARLHRLREIAGAPPKFETSMERMRLEEGQDFQKRPPEREKSKD